MRTMKPQTKGLLLLGWILACYPASSDARALDKEIVDPLQLSTFDGYEYDFVVQPQGVYKFYYSLPDSSRYEERSDSGEVRGRYAFVAPEGDEYKFKYEAGKLGFLVESNALPVAPEDTDEVKKAKEAFFDAYYEALALAELDGYGEKEVKEETRRRPGRIEEDKEEQEEEDEEEEEEDDDDDDDESSEESSEEDDDHYLAESSEEHGYYESSEEYGESSEESSEEDDDDDEEEEEEEDERRVNSFKNSFKSRKYSPSFQAPKFIYTKPIEKPRYSIRPPSKPRNYYTGYTSHSGNQFPGYSGYSGYSSYGNKKRSPGHDAHRSFTRRTRNSRNSRIVRPKRRLITRAK